MNVLLAIGLFLLGLIIGAFGWGQILSVTRFGIPYARDLMRQNMLSAVNAARIVRSHKTARAVWMAIMLIVSVLIIWLAKTPLYILSYHVAVLVILLYTFGYTGPTKANIEEFVTRNFEALELGEDGASIETATNFLVYCESLRTVHLKVTKQKWPGIYK